MKYVTIIPARGGSKRFPGKNIDEFIGKPLIAHSIDCSKNCNSISHTFVSTDDEEIKQVSLQYSAEVIDRPADLGSDYATSADVMKNAVEQLMSQGVKFDYVILLQATNPLKPSGLLDNTIKVIEETKVDSLMMVNRSELKLGKIINNHFQP